MKDQLASNYISHSHVKLTLFSVVLATNITTRKIEAIKFFKAGTDITSAEIESKLVLSLSHPRILQATEYIPQMIVENSNKENVSDEAKLSSLPALVLEYAPNGELLSLITRHGYLPETLARTYFHQLIDAIEYIHSKGVCHLDIKPDNVLLDENYCLKLADFGLAMELGQKKCLKGVAGTSFYLSPEMHLDLKYDAYQADLFALGVTLFTMVSGIMPFQKAKLEDSYYKLIANRDFETFWKKHEALKKKSTNFYTANFRDLMEKMFALDPRSRLSIREIRNHPWLNEGVLMDERISSALKSLRVKQLPSVENEPVKRLPWLDVCY